MKNINLNGIEYLIEKNYKDSINKEELESLFTEHFNQYDYVAGDYSYNKLRLKGFFDTKNKKVQRYNDAVKRAPIRIYDVYVELYIRNNTQESLADKWRYSTQTIKRLNGKLYDYLQANLR